MPVSELPAIDWFGLTVVDPTPAPLPRRDTQADFEHDVCLRSARQFYARWEE